MMIKSLKNYRSENGVLDFLMKQGNMNYILKGQRTLLPKILDA